MKILNIAISFIVIVAVCMLASSDTGGIGSLWDGISLGIVLIPAYLLTAAAANSYTFYNDKKSVLLFGNLTLGFGLIGVMLGLIFMLASMALPPVSGVDPTAALISNIAISLITLLYGLIFKYFFALPWAHSLKEN
jgi:hypothetical protein